MERRHTFNSTTCCVKLNVFALHCQCVQTHTHVVYLFGCCSLCFVIVYFDLVSFCRVSLLYMKPLFSSCDFCFGGILHSSCCVNPCCRSRSWLQTLRAILSKLCLFLCFFVSIWSFFPEHFSSGYKFPFSNICGRKKIPLTVFSSLSSLTLFLHKKKVTVCQPQLLYLRSFTSVFVAQPAVWIPHSAFLFFKKKKRKG